MAGPFPAEAEETNWAARMRGSGSPELSETPSSCSAPLARRLRVLSRRPPSPSPGRRDAAGTVTARGRAQRGRDEAMGTVAAGGTAWQSKRPPRKPSPATRSAVSVGCERVELGSVRPRAQPQWVRKASSQSAHPLTNPNPISLYHYWLEWFGFFASYALRLASRGFLSSAAATSRRRAIPADSAASSANSRLVSSD
nr:unnamed protein product [Digitaria exilis]